MSSRIIEADVATLRSVAGRVEQSMSTLYKNYTAMDAVWTECEADFDDGSGEAVRDSLNEVLKEFQKCIHLCADATDFLRAYADKLEA